MTGVVTLSIKLKFGWGYAHQAEYDHPSSDRSSETERSTACCYLADHLNLPITFDIVGHLFHNSCSGSITEPPGVVVG
jgi:hypothetical protein